MSIRGSLRKAGISSDGANIDVFRGTLTARNVITPEGDSFYVDCRRSISGNGKSWNTAFVTIQEAITASNAQIDWSLTPWLVDNWIHVASGLYEEALTPPYSCHIIGYGVLGTDTAVEIHPAAGSAMAGTGLGLEMVNIRFEAVNAVPVLDFGVCNQVIIRDCEILPATNSVTHGISIENGTHVRILRNSFHQSQGTPGFSHGIYAAGGADKYLHASKIIGNYISGIASGGVGIYIAADCTATETLIQDNTINVPGAGIGIDDNNGNSLVVDNRIFVGGSGDAIDHAGGASKTLGNLCNVNGTVLWETTIS